MATNCDNTTRTYGINEGGSDRHTIEALSVTHISTSEHKHGRASFAILLPLASIGGVKVLNLQENDP